MDPVELLKRFKKTKICVIGDTIADVYIYGRPYRLSREAPVIVVKYEGEKVLPGSAGNTINNLLSLGATVYPLSFIGKDEMGEKILSYFSRFKNIDLEGFIRCEGETITKTRILAGDIHTSKQQVIRIDKDEGFIVEEKDRKRLFERLYSIIDKVDALIISDYGYNTVDKEILDFVREKRKGAITVGDSRFNLRDLYNFTILTPNEAEAKDLFFSLRGRFEKEIEEMGKEILKEMALEALLITRGNKGMSLFLKDSVHHIPVTSKEEVTDVTGAGDTVCAVFTLCLASGADFFTSAVISNIAAGIVVMKRGTATVTEEELLKGIKRWEESYRISKS